MIKDYENPADETDNNFLLTTHGDWIYIHANFLLDCYREKTLLDPAPYILPVDSTSFTRSRSTMITRLMYRQRHSTSDAPGQLILAQSALRLTNRKKIVRIQRPYTNNKTRLTNRRVRDRVAKIRRGITPMTVNQRALQLYLKDFASRSVYEQSVSTTSNASKYKSWRETKALRDRFRLQASQEPDNLTAGGSIDHT